GSWARDGAIFFAQRNPNTQWDIDYLSSGSRSPTPLAHSPANETNVALSADGRLVAYMSDETGGSTTQLYVARFPHLANRKQVTTAGADIVHWGPNDREIFFGAQTDVMTVPVASGPQGVEIGAPKLLFHMKGNCSFLNGDCFDVTRDG